MRVLMLASYFPKPANPVMGNWALSQARALQQAGMEVRVVSGTSWVPGLFANTPGARAYADCPPRHDWDGIEAFYPRWLFYSFRGLYQSLSENPAPQIHLAWQSVKREIFRHVDEYRPDLVYAHHTQINGFLARQIHLRNGLPYVITDHDFGELSACQSSPRRHRFFRDIVENSSRMVAVATRMENLMRVAFPAARTLTVNNGTVDPPPQIFSTPRPPELRDVTVVFSACAFFERKGVPLLIHSFREAVQRYPDAVLRIAGSGEQRPVIEKAIAECGLASRVALLGMLPHAQVLQEMAWSDIFALPGWDEPFATAFSEALSTGRPIIYGSDGGITDVVGDGVHGVAVKPRDQASVVRALYALLGDIEGRRRMGLAARNLFETQLKWSHNAERMKQVFIEALAHV